MEDFKGKSPSGEGLFLYDFVDEIMKKVYKKIDEIKTNIWKW